MEKREEKERRKTYENLRMLVSQPHRLLRRPDLLVRHSLFSLAQPLRRQVPQDRLIRVENDGVGAVADTVGVDLEALEVG
jgi:hypothetical protein